MSSKSLGENIFSFQMVGSIMPLFYILNVVLGKSEASLTFLLVNDLLSLTMCLEYFFIYFKV